MIYNTTNYDLIKLFTIPLINRVTYIELYYLFQLLSMAYIKPAFNITYHHILFQCAIIISNFKICLNLLQINCYYF